MSVSCFTGKSVCCFDIVSFNVDTLFLSLCIRFVHCIDSMHNARFAGCYGNNLKDICVFRCDGVPIILSFSGCYNDDEAVLKWKREKDEVVLSVLLTYKIISAA